MEIINGSVYAKTGSRTIRGSLVMSVHIGQSILEELCNPSNGGGSYMNYRLTRSK